jgi:hypothetical protein
LTHPFGGFADAACAADGDSRGEMRRTFIIASALEPQTAARVAAAAPKPIDLVVVSPTLLAREAAAIVVGGRWVFTVEEPLLAPRASAESGADVLARLARALRGLTAFEAAAPLVVLDALDVLGAGVFVLDEQGVARAADDLERLLAVS